MAIVNTLGLSIGEHVMTYYRDWLNQQGVLTIQELATCPVGRRVRVAGLLVVHQSPPTAKGFHCSARDGASHIQLLEQMIPHFPAELWLVIEDNLTIHKSRDVQTTLLA